MWVEKIIIVAPFDRCLPDKFRIGGLKRFPETDRLGYNPTHQKTIDDATMSYYKHHVFFCTNQRDDGRSCCANQDAQALRDYAKERVKTLNLSGPGKCRINNAGCLDRCNKGPVVVVYPEAVWYSCKNRQDIDDIVQQHLIDGGIVERLKI